MLSMMASHAAVKEILAYPIRRSLYVNVTNACTARCHFCPRETCPTVQGFDLALGRNPPPEEFVAAVEEQLEPGKPEELVFCGFGEPTLRLDVIHAVARRAKQAGLRVRLNTNGHGSLIHGRLITPGLRGLVDAVSVSLNAADRESYEEIVRPRHHGAFAAVLGFIREAKINLPEVTATAVEDVPGADLDATRRLAEALGAGFRSRPLDRLG